MTTPKKRPVVRVAMNEARQSAIYSAVHEVFMQLRIDIRVAVPDWVDARISRAANHAGQEAMKAASARKVKR